MPVPLKVCALSDRHFGAGLPPAEGWTNGTTIQSNRPVQGVGIFSTWPTWILFGSVSLSLFASKIFM